MANVGRPKKQSRVYSEEQLSEKFAEYELWQTEQSIQQMSYFLYETILLLKDEIIQMSKTAEEDVVTQQQLRDLSYFMQIICEKDSPEYQAWLESKHRIQSKLSARKKRAEMNKNDKEISSNNNKK